MGQIYEITPFTLLDYPGEMACIVWFAGCNMRCLYCHNPAIVQGKGEKTEADLLDFLRTRTGRLVGVVFSGGEATLYPDLSSLMRQVKDLGFKIKLDTNGTRPAVLKDLLEGNLLDYVALDYKAPAEKLEALVGTAKYVDAFKESLLLLIEAAKNGMGFEVRTTVHADLLDENDIASLIHDLDEAGYSGTYYVQNVFSYGEKTIGKVEAPTREIDISQLPQPSGFKIDFRNFKAKKAE